MSSLCTPERNANHKCTLLFLPNYWSSDRLTPLHPDYTLSQTHLGREISEAVKKIVYGGFDWPAPDGETHPKRKAISSVTHLQSFCNLKHTLQAVAGAFAISLRDAGREPTTPFAPCGE